MNLKRSLFCLLCVLLVPAYSLAQQEVTLKSGTVLTGKVEMAGDKVVVDVSGAKLEIAFDQIATIVPAGNSDDTQPQRLLRMALERRILSDNTENEGVGLLAEAYRLAPDDPSVAFWYAYGMEAAGNGEAANKVINQHRETLAEKYPGVFEPLVARVERRLELKDLPEPMRIRLDQFLKAAKIQEFSNEEYKIALTFFQLLDQEGKPLKKDDFRITTNSVRDSQLAAFEDGYFIHTCKHYRNRSNAKCDLAITGGDFKPKTFSILSPPYRVTDLGKLVADHFTSADAVTGQIKFVDAQQQPVANATASLSTYGGNSSKKEWTATSNESGIAELKLYPRVYTVYGSLDGFIHGGTRNTRLDLTAEKPEPAKITMYRTLTGKLKVSRRIAQNGKFSDPTVSWIEIKDGKNISSKNLHWLAVGQKDGKLLASLGIQYNAGQIRSAWVRSVEPAKTDSAKLDTVSPGEWNRLNRELNPPEKLPRSRYYGNAAETFQLKPDQTYVGEITFDTNQHNGSDQSMASTAQFEIHVETIEPSPIEEKDKSED